MNWIDCWGFNGSRMLRLPFRWGYADAARAKRLFHDYGLRRELRSYNRMDEILLPDYGRFITIHPSSPEIQLSGFPSARTELELLAFWMIASNHSNDVPGSSR